MSQSTADNPQFIERMVMLVAVLGTAMVYLDQTALNIALPNIQETLSADIDGIQWLIDIYILILATLLLLGGVLGDRYGRVRIYLIGMIIFVAASIACGAAQDIDFLLWARAAQGIGGALLVPGGLALINATFSQERRGRAIGTWGMMTSLVIAFGPSLGGMLIDTFSWRFIFYINVPLGVAACIIGYYYVPESWDETSEGALDWLGATMLLIGLGGLLYGLIEGPHLGWEHPLIIGTLIAGILGLILFVVVEAYVPNPLMPLHLFRNWQFSGINLITVIHWISLSSIFFFLPLSLQQVHEYSAFYAGLAMFPLSVAIILLSRPVGRVTDQQGPFWPLVVGIILTIIGFFLFMIPGSETNYWLTFFPATIVYGVGLGITIVPVTTAAMTALPERYSGIASGLNNAASRVAQMLAVAIFGSVMLVTFQATLMDQVTPLSLDETVRAELQEESRKLGATQPPDSVSPELKESITLIIKDSFVTSFRRIMIISSVLSIVSLAIIIFTLRFPKKSEIIDGSTFAVIDSH